MLAQENLLGETESVCSQCLRPVSAKIVERDGQVWLEKLCDEHGLEWVLESSSKDFYHVAVPAGGCCSSAADSSTCCASDQVNSGEQEPLGPSCVLLLEITDVCNLECPLCFASSGPKGKFFMTLEEAKTRITKVVEKKGVVDILMLSGGEPTAHPEFPSFLEFVDRHPQIQRVMLNTNALLLSKPGRIREAVEANRKRLELYLQFDSFGIEQAIRFRGEDEVLTAKRHALDWLTEKNLPVTLAAAVDKRTSLEDVRDLLDFAIQTANIRGVTFQPVFASGRHRLPYDPTSRVTTPDVVRLITSAEPELFRRESFINLPCSHPNCAIVSYYYRANNRLWSLCDEIVPEASLANRINFTLEDLKKCGCETTELGQYVRSAELSSENSFRIVVKPFMDRFTLNRSRTKQCCTHVAGPNGKLMSFCEYNVAREQLEWNRNDSDHS